MATSRLATAAIALAILAGCTEARSSAWDEASDDRDLMGENWIQPGEVRGGFTYAEFDEERDRNPSGDFRGFGCLGSCDGHEAGYAWAGENGIGEPSECGGNSWSFTEGCMAWVVETYEPPEGDERPERGLY
jgi:hypothetical protein